jgi:hypothetical protein
MIPPESVRTSRCKCAASLVNIQICAQIPLAGKRRPLAGPSKYTQVSN